MLRPCVNKGGPATIIRVAGTLQSEREVILEPEAETALACWEPRLGEVYTLVDARQNCWRARLARQDAAGSLLIPFQQLAGVAESPLEIVVFQALPEKERFELILQKLTEIGVSRIVPFHCQRSVTLEERDAGQKKSHRWPDVLLRAAKQCRRGMLPELAPVLSWDDMLKEAAAADLRLMLFEGTTFWSLKEAMHKQNPGRVALLVGPEGGFSAEESAQAQDLGVLSVSLGSRILRTETAAIVGAALVQFTLGDLG